MEKLGDALDAERCFDFLQSSHYIEMEADAWRLAIDATENQTDVCRPRWRSCVSRMAI